MISEFEIIRRFFSRPAPSAVLGVGDDCALLRPREGLALAVSTDMLSAGTHFLPDTDPERLGHKCLAVNLSDLAAMGAEPRWAVLALALPEADETWLSAFAQGFYRVAARHGIELVGGDTTRGPLTITITVLGEVAQEAALRRDGARAGDDIWVSGATGLAALALEHQAGRVRLPEAALAVCLEKLNVPEPRVELGRRLLGLSRCAIDVSDGLLADLTHVLEASGVGAELDYERLPRHPVLAAYPDQDLATRCIVAGGDDYELLFTAPRSQRAAIAALPAQLGLALTRIGSIVAGSAVAVLRNAEGKVVPTPVQGYDHFR